MKITFSVITAVILSLGILTACQNAAPPVKVEQTANRTNTAVNNAAAANAPKVDEHGHSDSAERISIADAKKEFDSGNAVFVDTRAEATYKNERIKGAINVPVEKFDSLYKNIPRDKKIIAYCS